MIILFHVYFSGHADGTEPGSIWISSPLETDIGPELLKKAKWPHIVGTLLDSCFVCEREFIGNAQEMSALNVVWDSCLLNISVPSRDGEPCVNCKTSKERPQAPSCPCVVYLSSLLHKPMSHRRIQKITLTYF